MVRGERREEGSGWGTRVYLWWIHVDIWQNQYNIVKLKKNGDIKGTFHAKIKGSIKDRNGRDLTEAEEVKKWQEYTEELYAEGLKELNNMTMM